MRFLKWFYSSCVTHPRWQRSTPFFRFTVPLALVLWVVTGYLMTTPLVWYHFVNSVTHLPVAQLNLLGLFCAAWFILGGIYTFVCFLAVMIEGFGVNFKVVWWTLRGLFVWRSRIEPGVTGPFLPVGNWDISWPKKIVGRETVEFYKERFNWYHGQWDECRRSFSSLSASQSGVRIVPINDSSALTEAWVELCAECKSDNRQRYEEWCEEQLAKTEAQKAIAAKLPLSDARKVMKGLS